MQGMSSNIISRKSFNLNDYCMGSFCAPEPRTGWHKPADVGRGGNRKLK